MEQHSENRVTHEALMNELIEGERNGAGATIDYEIPEFQESMKTPDFVETIENFQLAQEVQF